VAFLDHIDPGNSGGSVLIPEARVRTPIQPVMPQCSICGERFKNQSTLNEHRISEHPVKRPMLLINGQGLRRDNVTVRAKILPGEITFTDVDEMYVNDEKIGDQEELINWLCNSNPISFILRLVNKSYPVEYRWNIDIADAKELDVVDETFYSVFGNSLELVRSFSLFNKKVVGFSSAAKNYAAGLSCYVASVITKDQLPGATLDYEKYNHKLGEAMDLLSDYQGRPLASAIYSISEFMQNDFGLLVSDVFLPKLQVTKHFFNSGKFTEVESLSIKFKAIPVDLATDKIVEFCSSSLELKSLSINEIEILFKATTTDSRDRIKSAFIQWCFYRLTGEVERIKMLRGKLIHSPFFGRLIESIEETGNE